MLPEPCYLDERWHLKYGALSISSVGPLNRNGSRLVVGRERRHCDENRRSRVCREKRNRCRGTCISNCRGMSLGKCIYCRGIHRRMNGKIKLFEYAYLSYSSCRRRAPAESHEGRIFKESSKTAGNGLSKLQARKMQTKLPGIWRGRTRGNILRISLARSHDYFR